jgi:hypothetical protein
MSIIQKIFKFILPKKYFEKIEEESKKWFFVCDCGYEKSVWDAGGLRFSAFPKKKPVVGKCPQCGKIGVMHLIKKS